MTLLTGIAYIKHNVLLAAKHVRKHGTTSQLKAIENALLVDVVWLYKRGIWFYYCDKEYENMARFRSMEFASVKLDKADKKKFLEWANQGDITHESALTELLGAGFKISLSFVAEQNSYCFTIVGTDNTRDHRNMCMTSWSDDYGEAILIGAYKHFVVCDSGEWPTHDTEDRWG